MEPSHTSSITSLRAVIVLVLPLLGSLATGLPQGRLSGADTLTVDDRGTNPSLVELSSRGDLVRREASLKQTPAGVGDVKQDGAVTVIDAAKSESEVVHLEELTEECLYEGSPTAECMEKFGSYGIRKLFTETFSNIQKLGYLRPGWMSHPEVQKKKLLELTLPGTLNSGSYAIVGEDATAAMTQPYGIVSQNLDFFQQLQLGVRLFDIRVAYSPETSLVYISHGALLVPLSRALQDVQRFLVEHDREVVILDVRQDDNADPTHLKPFREEEASKQRVPGQLVHEAVACELREMLATYKALAKLPGNAFAENPSIGNLVDTGARVVYYWNSQQVLCTTLEECKTTPGWHPADVKSGYSYAFGPPFKLGTRINATGGRTTARMVEPGCSVHSRFFTENGEPEEVIKNLKLFSMDMMSKVSETRPKCFPINVPIPAIHSPTLLYILDAFVTASSEEQQAQAERMRGVKAIYTRGEGFTLKTEAERTNYLLLSWFLSNRELLSRPNAIMMEYAGAGAMNIVRIIEAMQGRPDCGWAVYCKDSGSCWADTLLGAEDMCLPEKEVQQKLKEHADGKAMVTKYVVYLSICAVAFVFLCFLMRALEQLFNSVMYNRKPKEAEEALTEGREDLISEPDSILSLPDELPVVAAAPAGGPAASLAVGADDDDAP